MKLIVIVNANSRNGLKALEEINNFINEKKHILLNDINNVKAEDSKTIIERHSLEADAIVVAGGDGSANAILPVLLICKLPLLVVPVGTANNFATTLKIPKNVNESMELLETGRLKEVDLGLVNEIPFLNLVGTGLSTRVNQSVNPQLKRFLGPIAFAVTALRVIRSMVPFYVKVHYDNKIHRGLSWQVTICNGRHYGSNLVIHEDATLVDETLHVMSIEMAKWWHGFLLLRSFLKGRFNDKDPVWVEPAKKIELRTFVHKRVDIDGDIRLRTPIEVTVIPKAIKVFVPQIPAGK